MRKPKERGAAAIETALVLSLLLTIALGAFEWGMAFREWSSVVSGSREAARVAAAAGDEPLADCAILEAAAGALIDVNDIVRVRIYRWRLDLTPAQKDLESVYRRAIPGDTALICGSWVRLGDAYRQGTYNPPSGGLRDNQGAVRDWIGVEIEWDYDWITGFAFWRGSICNNGASLNPCWRQSTVMHIEPDPTP